MEIAEFNGDKADRTLLKRIPYYGIGISLPFILMRHWEEWQSSRTLTMDDDEFLAAFALAIDVEDGMPFAVGLQLLRRQVL